jgi:protein-S-isoprenylcysteine O-methyltransferase Ste14
MGYPLAALVLWLAHPTWRSMAVGAAVAAIGLVIRGAAAGYLQKGQVLATTGPYARTRNPLYFGSALMTLGFGIASRSWIAAVLLVAFFRIFYYQTMRREEGELRQRFGEAFDEYARRVPLFWPRLRAAPTPGAASMGSFSWAQYLRNREYRAAVGLTLLMGIFAAMVIWRR